MAKKVKVGKVELVPGQQVLVDGVLQTFIHKQVDVYFYFQEDYVGGGSCTRGMRKWDVDNLVIVPIPKKATKAQIKALKSIVKK